MPAKVGLCGFTIGAAAYFETFGVVEVQQTFYDPPSPGLRILWEPRGPWPDDLVTALCREIGLVHAVDPFIRPSLTPELTYWRLHGNGSHYASYADEELEQLRAQLSSAPEAYVMFNNIPRVGDAKRFIALRNDT